MDAYSSYEYDEQRKATNAAEARVAKLELQIKKLKTERKKLLNISKLAVKAYDQLRGCGFDDLCDAIDLLEKK